MLAFAVLPGAAGAAAPARCEGDPLRHPDRVMTGSFESEREGSFVLLPFRAPPPATAVRVKYCYDQPESPTSEQIRHTLDLGLYEPRERGRRVWGNPEFRGWSGSGHSDVTVSPQGFSSEEAYEQGDRVPGKTTRSYRPGPIPAGRWAVELGLAQVASEAEGDADGAVAYRVEIKLRESRRLTRDPYEPAPYDGGPVRGKAGWYAGDFHVHAEHSGDSDATMTEVFDYAFTPRGAGGAGLDFLTLNDHNTDSAWGEIGRYQDDHPRHLVIPGEEVTTYRGHLNGHAGRHVDYRTGRLYVRRHGDELHKLRGRRPPRAIFRALKRAGGFTQINHPTIFPSPGPAFELCRGCPWEYSDRRTGYRFVDAIEIATGPSSLDTHTEPGPNPFTATAIEFWERALDKGHKIAAVGASDSHRAGEADEPTQAPIGEATTVVRASKLSQEAVERAVEAGHTYVKVTGGGAPDLRLTATEPGPNGERAIMGDTLRASRAGFRARVIGGGPASDPSSPEPYELFVIKDGEPFLGPILVTSDSFTFEFPGTAPGRYRLQLQRTTRIETLTSPIYLEAPGG